MVGVRQNDDWKNLWERTKTQLGLDEKDFPSNHATLEDLTQPELEENLLEAAATVQKAPQPGRRQKVSDKLAKYSEKVNRGHKGKRAILGTSSGAAGGRALASTTGAAEPALATLGGAVIGPIAANGDMLASMSLAEASHIIKPKERQATKESYKSAWSIKHDLEEDTGPYAVKAFDEEGETGYIEILNYEELETFLDDLSNEADSSWRVKNKEDHPLVCTGIDAEFHNNNDRDTYGKRKRLAREVANAEDGPYEETSVEEVLDVSGNPEQPETVPTEQYGTETNYQFAIVSLDPSYSFDAENDWYDYGDVLSLEDREENEVYDEELEEA